MVNLLQKITTRIVVYVRRTINRQSLYSYPEANDGWKKVSQAIKDDRDTLFDPYVLRDKQDYIFVSNRNKNTIERYEANENGNLKNPIDVLGAGTIDSWDAKVNRACVIKVDNKYLMWYTGQSKNESMIGLATSIDGVTYNKFKGNPIVVATLPYEKNNVMNPCVIWDEKDNIFKMWYASGEFYEPDNICYATSYDGIYWEKRKVPVLFKGTEKYDRYKVGGCDVHKYEDKYIMFYIGYENLDNARICVAFSKDGVHDWERSDSNPIITPTKKGWDSDAVYKPCVLIDKNKMRMWYNGRKRDKESIGYAVKEFNE